jgi:uncharacterized membrane protein
MNARPAIIKDCSAVVEWFVTNFVLVTAVAVVTMVIGRIVYPSAPARQMLSYNGLVERHATHGDISRKIWPNFGHPASAYQGRKR